MGYAKRLLEEATEGGLNLLASEGRHVCAECFTGEALRRFVRENARATSCSFCSAAASSPMAAPLRVVVEYLNDCLLNHYDDPANWLPYETAEGGYQGDTLDTWEILENAGFHDELVNDGGELLDLIREALGDRTWCENDPYALREHQRLSLSWDRFCTLIKHERRFFFMTDPSPSSDPDEGDRLLAPAGMLETLVERSIVLGLITTMPAATLLYRVRPQPPEKMFRTALELGAPPPAFANQTNRMSPPGVVMTYLALDHETAFAETMPASTEPSPSTTYAVGEFALTREVNVLDLTRVPSIPSIFDLERASEREAVLFLRAFERDVSKPIERDDRVHVEYIPTQVVTEYVRVAPQLVDAGVRGMKYRSSRRKGGVNLVLFGGRELLELSATEREQLAPFERRQASRQDSCLWLTTACERTI